MFLLLSRKRIDQFNCIHPQFQQEESLEVKHDSQEGTQRDNDKVHSQTGNSMNNSQVLSARELRPTLNSLATLPAS